SAAIQSAFTQLASARASHEPRLRGRDRRRARGRGMSAEALGAMAADARDAVALVIADRMVLARWLAEVRVTEAELRRDVEAAQDPIRKAELARMVEVSATHAASLREQLMASVVASEKAKEQLGKLFRQLPEPAKEAAQRRRPEPPAGDRN